jgi:hypothetical protein
MSTTMRFGNEIKISLYRNSSLGCLHPREWFRDASGRAIDTDVQESQRVHAEPNRRFTAAHDAGGESRTIGVGVFDGAGIDVAQARRILGNGIGTYAFIGDFAGDAGTPQEGARKRNLLQK